MSRAETILVVEDSQEALCLMTELLNRAGYQVRPADSGELALTFVEASLPDLVLLDLKLSGLNGLEVCHQLKCQPKTRHIPVIFISGASENEDRVQGFVCGAVDFIQKPVNEAELLARVKMHLELSRLRQHLEACIQEKTLHLKEINRQLAAELNEHHRMEALLRESERKYRRVADHTYDWEWFQDPEGCFLYSSPSCQRVTGYLPEELPDQPSIEALIHPKDLEKWREHLAETKGPGKHCELECRIHTKDGSLRWIAHACQPVYEQGHYLGQRGSNRDITAQKQAEAENAELKSKIERAAKMESLGRLAGGVAHHINNVLGAILGFASVHLAKQEPGTPLHRAFDVINQAALRGGHVVRELLAFARREPAEKREIQLNTFLQDTIRWPERSLYSRPLVDAPNAGKSAVLSEPARNGVSSMAHDTNSLSPAFESESVSAIQFKLSLAEDLKPIEGDENALSQAFTAILVNAQDAMPRGGRLQVSTSNLGEAWVEVIISDTGKGMSKEVIERALDPFFSTKDHGMGLGLSLAYSAVREHGGELSLQSEEGLGTQVFLRFPAIQKEVAVQP